MQYFSGFVGALYLAIGVYIYLKNKYSPLHVSFLFFCVMSAVWAMIHGQTLVTATEQDSLFWIRNEMSGAIFHAYSLYAFVMIYTRNYSVQSILKSRNLLLGLIFTILISIIAQTDFIFESVKGVGILSSPVPGIGIGLFGLVAGYFIGASIFGLNKFRVASKGIAKAQAQYLLLGIVLSAALIFISSFLLVVVFNNNSLIFLSTAYAFAFIVSAGYAMVVYQLFDIRLIIKKTLVYSVLFAVLVTIYVFVIYIITAIFDRSFEVNFSTIGSNIFAAILIALGFDPLRTVLTQLTDKYLFVGSYKPQEVISELAERLTSVLDLDEALKSMMNALVTALRTQTSATLILTRGEQTGRTQVQRIQSLGYEMMPQPRDGGYGTLIEYFQRNNLLKSLVADELRFHLDRLEDGTKPERTQSGQANGEINGAIKNESATLKAANQPQSRLLLAELDALGAAIALPIKVNTKLIGILIVGAKKSGDVFTKDDIQFLDIIAKQTASAIEKSRFYQDDQLKSEFVSIASHELLTPTAAIQGYLSMILDEKMAQVDPKAEEYLRKVQNSAHRLAELVTDLLSVSRIEGGRIVINKAPQLVAPLIKQVVDEIKVKADMAQIQLRVEADTLVNLPLIMTDPDRFIQIAMNLISNAIKYGRAGGQVSVSAESDTQSQMVVVHVSDNGIGIPAEHLPHLFEKFYRVHDDSAAAEKVGTGLGLYITRSIVELQGGRIWVRSVAGRGSQFSFSLPFAKPAEIQATGPAERATISTPIATSPTQ